MSAAIRVLTSMTTSALLAELAGAFEERTGRAVGVESVGGVDAAKRVQAGEAFDVVVLDRQAIEALLAADHLVAGSVADIVRSRVAVAVRAGAPRPAVGTEDALRRAVLEARTIGCSTGPSGVALRRLFERWGILDAVSKKIVTARPGKPVGELVARGEAELGFQQASELAHVCGIDVLGPLPAAVALVSTFSAGVAAASTQADAARSLVAFLTSPAARHAKERQGLEPADGGAGPGEEPRA